MEGVECFGIGDTDIFCAANVLQKCVLGADAGVIEAGADAMRFRDLTVLILQNISAITVQYAWQATL